MQARGGPPPSTVLLRMTSSDRAKARESWPVRRYPLGEEPSDDLSATTTAEQRLEMVAVLSRRMWELTGRPTPTYRRDQMPGRVIRPA